MKIFFFSSSFLYTSVIIIHIWLPAVSGESKKKQQRRCRRWIVRQFCRKAVAERLVRSLWLFRRLLQSTFSPTYIRNPTIGPALYLVYVMQIGRNLLDLLYCGLPHQPHNKLATGRTLHRTGCTRPVNQVWNTKI